MRSLAEYVLRGRRQAILTALFFSFLPLLGWISSAIMALVTLRKGAKEGGIVLLWLILPAIVLAALGYQDLLLYNVLGTVLVVYGFALVLRKTASWTLLLQIGVLCGIAAVVLVHLYNPDITAYWQKNWSASLLTLKQQFNLAADAGEMQQLAQFMAQIATGMQAVIMLIANLTSVAVARWWQATLFNQGGFKDEVRNIRVDLVVMIVLLLGVIGWASDVSWLVDSLPVMLLPFIVATYSLLHFLVASKKLSAWWLYGSYLMFVISFPYFTLVLVLVSLCDYWMNFRQRFMA